MTSPSGSACAPGSRLTSPLMRTRPAPRSASAPRRELSPLWARILLMRIGGSGDVSRLGGALRAFGARGPDGGGLRRRRLDDDRIGGGALGVDRIGMRGVGRVGVADGGLGGGRGIDQDELAVHL